MHTAPLRKLTLLPATELLNALLIIVLTVEADTDTHAGIILHSTLVDRLFIFGLVITGLSLVGLALNDQSATTCRDEFLEDLGECFADLFERTLNGFVLSLIENLDEILDRCFCSFEILSSRFQLLALFG